MLKLAKKSGPAVLRGSVELTVDEARAVMAGLLLMMQAGQHHHIPDMAKPMLRAVKKINKAFGVKGGA